MNVQRRVTWTLTVAMSASLLSRSPVRAVEKAGLKVFAKKGLGGLTKVAVGNLLMTGNDRRGDAIGAPPNTDCRLETKAGLESRTDCTQFDGFSIQYCSDISLIGLTGVADLATTQPPPLPSGCVRAAGSPTESSTLGILARRVRDAAEMVWVAEGDFQSGSMFGTYVEWRFQRQRHVSGFWLDRCEVTNTQYAAFCRATGYPPPGLWPKGHLPRGLEAHPVCGVCWEDARMYAAWVGGRLPTEADWEYAARGVKALRYPWGEELVARNATWCRNRPATLTSPVGSHPEGASWCGVLDLAGNALEWVLGYFNGFEGTGGLEARTGREYQVLRGGSFYTMAECLKGSYRHLVRPGTVRSDFGFRVAMDVPGRGWRQPPQRWAAVAARAARSRPKVTPLDLRSRRPTSGAGALDWPLPRRDLQYSGFSPARGQMSGPPKLRCEVTWGTERRGTLPRSWSLVTDMDGDGRKELLWMPAGRLACTEASGSTRWTSDGGEVDWVADVDEDGQVELLCGGKVVSARDGKVLWTPPELHGGMGQYFVGKFIPGLKGLQVAGCSEGPDQSNWAHVFTFEEGIAAGKLRWEKQMHPPSLAHVRGTVGQLGGRWVVMCTPQGRIKVRDIETGEMTFQAEWMAGRELVRNYGLHQITDLDGDGRSEILLLNDFVPQLVAFAPHRSTLRSPMLWQNWIGWAGGKTGYYMQVATDSLCRPSRGSPLEALVSVHNLKMPGWALYGFDALTGKANWLHPGLSILAVSDLDSDGTMEILSECQPGPIKVEFPGIEVGRVTGTGNAQRYQTLWNHPAARLERNERLPLRQDKGGYALDTFLRFQSFFFADLEGDGNQEFLVAVDEDADQSADRVIAVGCTGGKVVSKCSWPAPTTATPDGPRKGLRVIAWGDWRPEPGAELLLGDSSGLLEVLSAKGQRLHVFLEAAPEAPGGLGDVAIADLDHDGRNELLGTTSSGDVSVFRLPPAPDGKLTEEWHVRARPLFSLYRGVHTVDVDGDGKRELLVSLGGSADGGIALLNWDGKVRWKTPFAQTTPLAKNPAFGDFNGDGVLDVAVCRVEVRDYTGGGGTVMALNGRDGTVLWKADPGVYYAHVLNPFRAVLVWDFNRDGRDDLMGLVADSVYSMDGRDGTMLQLPADLTCKFNELKPQCSWSAWGGVVLADADLDGEPETVLTTGNIGVQGAWDLQTRRPLWMNDAGPGYWGELPAMGDVDGDGRLEVMLADSKFHYCIRDARTGGVEWDQEALSLPSCAPTGVSADIDGDGRTDFLQAWGGWLWAVGSDTAGKVGLKWKVAVPTVDNQSTPPMVADFDNDGQPEIILRGTPMRVYDTP